MIPVLLGMLLYGIIHSLLAGRRLKEAFRHQFGDRAYYGLYRLFFNTFAVISILPIVWLISRPGEVIWRVPAGWQPGLLLIQGVGMIGIGVSLLQIDLMRFAGLRQLWAYLEGQPLPLPEEPLQTGGVYGLVRHPLYLFSLMIIWPVATMTGPYLGFCLGATAYFLIGSLYEERRMVESMGQTYEQYRRRVPWLLPLPRNKS